uniref:Death domain-containing protein n=1 Tax=Branchiostoma floridae TaxID=7739 RepID=C3XV34_BRAFL|eukprot:XP_002611951.1 hypothetical protein BRAFLDRAFT_91835 [Branchiostoma floridae]
MSWTDRHNNPGYKNWLRVGIALLTTRDGLTNVTLQAAKELQAELKAKLGDDVEKCTCNSKSRGCTDCELWREELKTYYTGDPNRIGWTNCTPTAFLPMLCLKQLLNKVFMLKGQPADNTGPEKSDPSALLNFLVIEVRNKAMHSLDLTFDSQTFNEYMDKMERLLRLVADTTAKEAAEEILKMKKEEFHIGDNKACMDAEVRVLTDVMKEHKKLLQLHREELEDHGTQLDTLEHSTEEIRKTVEVISDMVNNNSDLQCLKDQVLGLLELSTTVQQHDDRLEKAEGDITDVKSAMSQLEETVADQGAQIEVNTQKLQLLQLEAPSGSTISLDVFKKSVKKFYELKLTHFKPLIWNENFTHSLSDIFTQLELVPKCEKQLKTSEEHNRSESMGKEQRKKLKSLDDLFNPDVIGLSTAPRCILIEGEAGGGKTTFLSKEALDAVSLKTELGIRHDFVLLIRLRELRQGETIEEMVWDQCVPESINVQSIRAILQRNESRVLFLLDGYDELRPEARAAGQTIPKLLSGKLFPNSTIVITSRPSAGVQQHTRPDCHVHIMGFSSEHVEKYMQQYFSVVKKQKLTMTLAEHVKYDRLLNTLIQTPIFLLFVCVLWEEDQEKVYTGTMTGLYDNLLKCLVRKHCKREGVDMPTEGLPTEVTEPLLQLGKLALEALLRNETLLDLTEVEKVKVNCELLLKLGLVSLEVSSSKLHPRKQLNFSHKTMQEFLAGRYVAHALLNQDIVELLQLTSITKALELSNLLQFTCGCDIRAAQAVMEELSNLSMKEFLHLQPDDFQIGGWLDSLYIKKIHPHVKPEVKKSVETYWRFVLLCLDILSVIKEPGIPVLQAVSRALPVIILDHGFDLDLSRQRTQHAALNYYLKNVQSSHLPERMILGSFVYTKALEDLEQIFTTPIPGLRLDLRLKKVPFDSWPADEADRLISILKNVPDLRALDLSFEFPISSANLAIGKYFLDNLLDMKERGETHSSFCLPMIMRVTENADSANSDLANPYLANPVLRTRVEVLQAVLSTVQNLAVLRLRGQWGVENKDMGKTEYCMTAEDMSSLAPYVRKLVGLTELDISHTMIGDTGLESLSTILPIFTDMKVLVLSYNRISFTGMHALVPALCQLTKLIKVDISGNAIGDPSLECLAAILHHLTAMQELILSDTCISDRGISSLIKALPHPVQLQVLDVSDNNIEIVSLVQTLCQSSSLDMEQNPPGDKSLITSLYCSTTHQHLYIGYKKINCQAVMGERSRDATLIRPGISNTVYVTPVHLRNIAAMALAEALPRLPALELLDLLYIFMDRAGFQAVVQAAEEHPTLKRLMCKMWGTAYVDREKLDIDLPTAELFYQKLLQLENHFREKYREVLLYHIPDICVSSWLRDKVRLVTQGKLQEKVSSDWKDLAFHLGLEQPDIDNIEGRNRDDKSRCMDLLEEWLKRNGERAIIEVLMEALSEANLQSGLDGLREKVEGKKCHYRILCVDFV